MSSERTRNALSAVRDAATIYVLSMSAILWLAYLRFYRELGIVPGDVGIGFGQVLERSIGALPYVAFLGAMLAVIALIVVGVGQRWWPKEAEVSWAQCVDEESRRDRWVFGRAWRLVLLPPIAWVAFDDLETLAWAVFVTLVLMAPWVMVLDTRLGRRLVIAVTLATASVAAALFSAAANDAATQVQAGRPSHIGDFRITNIRLPILALRATPARLRLGHRVHGALYLGSSDGAAVVYDLCAKRVERVPASRANVTFARGDARCR